MPLQGGTYRVTWIAEYRFPILGSSTDSHKVYEGTLRC